MTWERRGEIVTDDRRRGSFGRLLPNLRPGQRFSASVDEAGRVLLSPVVLVEDTRR